MGTISATTFLAARSCSDGTWLILLIIVQAILKLLNFFHKGVLRFIMIDIGRLLLLGLFLLGGFGAGWLALTLAVHLLLFLKILHRLVNLLVRTL